MLCVLTADETKAVSKISAVKMYTILRNREYICQGMNLGYIDCYKQIENMNTAEIYALQGDLGFHSE